MREVKQESDDEEDRAALRNRGTADDQEKTEELEFQQLTFAMNETDWEAHPALMQLMMKPVSWPKPNDYDLLLSITKCYLLYVSHDDEAVAIAAPIMKMLYRPTVNMRGRLVWGARETLHFQYMQGVLRHRIEGLAFTHEAANNIHIKQQQAQTIEEAVMEAFAGVQIGSVEDYQSVLERQGLHQRQREQQEGSQTYDTNTMTLMSIPPLRARSSVAMTPAIAMKDEKLFGDPRFLELRRAHPGKPKLLTSTTKPNEEFKQAPQAHHNLQLYVQQQSFDHDFERLDGRRAGNESNLEFDERRGIGTGDDVVGGDDRELDPTAKSEGDSLSISHGRYQHSYIPPTETRRERAKSDLQDLAERQVSQRVERVHSSLTESSFSKLHASTDRSGTQLQPSHEELQPRGPTYPSRHDREKVADLEEGSSDHRTVCRESGVLSDGESLACTKVRLGEEELSDHGSGSISGDSAARIIVRLPIARPRADKSADRTSEIPQERLEQCQQVYRPVSREMCTFDVEDWEKLSDQEEALLDDVNGVSKDALAEPLQRIWLYQSSMARYTMVDGEEEVDLSKVKLKYCWRTERIPFEDIEETAQACRQEGQSSANAVS